MKPNLLKPPVRVALARLIEIPDPGARALPWIGPTLTLPLIPVLRPVPLPSVFTVLGRLDRAGFFAFPLWLELRHRLRPPFSLASLRRRLVRDTGASRIAGGGL